MYRGKWRRRVALAGLSRRPRGRSTAQVRPEQPASMRLVSTLFTDETWDAIIQIIGRLLVLLGIAVFIIATAS